MMPMMADADQRCNGKRTIAEAPDEVATVASGRLLVPPAWLPRQRRRTKRAGAHRHPRVRTHVRAVQGEPKGSQLACGAASTVQREVLEAERAAVVGFRRYAIRDQRYAPSGLPLSTWDLGLWTFDFFSALQRDDVQVICARPDPGATVWERRDVIEGHREPRDGGCGGRVFDDRFQPPTERAKGEARRASGNGLDVHSLRPTPVPVPDPYLDGTTSEEAR
jgi:hypothetical protein